MKKWIHVSASTARANIRSIFKKLKEEYEDAELVTYDDEVVVWTIDGKKYSFNYKGIDPIDVEREMFDISADLSQDWIVDYPIEYDPDFDKKRLEREIADENDYYDQTHKEGIYSAWNVGEPSASEYGAAMDARRKQLATKYFPFVVTDFYRDNTSFDTPGYKITLDTESNWVEWILYPDIHVSRWSNDPKFRLLGPFEPGQIWDSWCLARNHNDEKVFTDKHFRGVDDAVSYLFTVVDEDGDEDEE